MRSMLLALSLALVAGVAVAQDWGKMAIISTTMGVNANQLCLGEESRGDIGCPTYAPYVTTGGLVGIGTTNPLYKLDVRGTGHFQSFVYTGDVNAPGRVTFIRPSDGTGQAYIGYSLTNSSTELQLLSGGGGSYLTLFTNATERMRIDNAGHVGIGTTSPAATLHVSATTPQLELTNGAVSGTGADWTMGVDSTGNWDLRSLDNLTTVISATAGGAMTMGNNSGSFLDLNRTAGGEYALAFLTDNAFKGEIRGLLAGGLHFTDATGGVDYMRITSSSRVGIAGILTPTVSLEVSGTVSATHFVGDGSGLTGIAASGDRVVSGSVTAVAEQTSGTVRVSGTLALVNTGNEVCDSSKWYSFRVNPSTGMMQMCRP